MFGHKIMIVSAKTADVIVYSLNQSYMCAGPAWNTFHILLTVLGWLLNHPYLLGLFNNYLTLTPHRLITYLFRS